MPVALHILLQGVLTWWDCSLNPRSQKWPLGMEWVGHTDPWSILIWNKGWVCPEHGISSRHAQGTGLSESSLSAWAGCNSAGEMKGHTVQGRIQGKPGYWCRDGWEVRPAHLSEPRGWMPVLGGDAGFVQEPGAEAEVQLEKMNLWTPSTHQGWDTQALAVSGHGTAETNRTWAVKCVSVTFLPVVAL